MRYFWQIFSFIVVLALITFLFFAFSVKVKNAINYTDKVNITAPEVTIADPTLGPADAPVTLIVFGDYECRTCSRLEGTLADLRTAYGDKLRIVWKDLPNSSAHSEAVNAAVAARCAGLQGKFWEYHSFIMANQDSLGSALYTALASDLKLKTTSFASCLTNQDTLPLVERTYEEGLALQIAATPSLWLYGAPYTGTIDIASLKHAIDLLLAATNK